MKHIRILYLEGCPNHEPALALAQTVVTDLNIDADISELEVKGPADAESLKFLGSPSIHVDDTDIDPQARDRNDFGFSCRTYAGRGLPPRAMLESALLGESPVPAANNHVSHARRHTGLWAAGTSFVAAVFASACCWIPLLLIASGASAGGIAVFFESTRPIFLTAAFLLLSFGFYTTYFRKQECEPGSTCEAARPKSGRFNQALLWIAAVGVVAFAALPGYVGLFLADPVDADGGAVSHNAATINVHIEGMTCEACAVNVRNEVAKIEGVLNARVNYGQKRAVIETDPKNLPATTSILAAIQRAGYRGWVSEGRTQ